MSSVPESDLRPLVTPPETASVGASRNDEATGPARSWSTLPIAASAGRHASRAIAQLLVAVAVPVAAIGTLLQFPSLNLNLEVPLQHFFIVTVVAAVALAISVVLAIEALKIQHYKLVLLAIGFMTMGGLFTIHGLATPGVILPESDQYAPGTVSVVGVSAFLSVLLPAVFFALAYSPLLDLYERHLPFWPVGLLIVVVGAGILIFGAVGLARAALISYLPVTSRPLAYSLALVGGACLTFASVRQLLSPRATLPLQTGLAYSFALLAVAEGAMVLAPVWTLAWWSYHFLMLGAVSVSIGAIALERRRSDSFRTILEAALDLQVRADLEIEQVAEIAALAAAIEVKDRNTRGHTARVADLTVAIARHLEMPNRDLQMLARAALLHDVGKLETPEKILKKAGPLDDSEWVEMRKHPEAGARMLRRMRKFEDELELVLDHHERLDGSGYPRHLAGNQIPLGARILAVADTYDSLVSSRPYREGMTEERAMQIMREEMGVRLDRVAVETLFALLAERPRNDRRLVPRTRRAAPARL